MKKKIAEFVLMVIIISAVFIAAFNISKHYQEKKSMIISAILVKLSPEEITKQSDEIIVGTVKSLQTVKAPSNFRAGEEDIVTNAVISVEKYLFNPKDLSSSEITVQTVGGTIGDQTMIMEDSPTFKEGQRVVVFLRQGKNNTFIVFGGPQGKYTVNNGNMADNEQERDVFNGVFGKQMTLDEFEKQINSIVSSPVLQK
jgi:hypothetical protein